MHKSIVGDTLPLHERQYAAFYERAIWTELRAKSLLEMRDLSREERETIKAVVASKVSKNFISVRLRGNVQIH